MPGVPNVKVARPRFDIRTAALKDLSFSSEYNLNKIAKTVRATGDSTVAHGLTYTPKFLTMKEPISGRYGWFANTKLSNTNIITTLGTHTIDYILYTTESDVSNITHVLIDNLTPGVYKKNMDGKPKLLLGVDTGTDYDFKLHSGYDTFKVHSTGTLTIDAPAYDPGSGGGVDVQTVTVNHNLGYAPMFAPFVDYETDMWFYHMANEAFNTSVVNSGFWLIGSQYYIDEDVMDDNFVWYSCKQTHVSSAITQPGIGASWTDYWELYADPDLINTYVNNLEDTKINLWVFGDDQMHNYHYIKYYSTATQLVLELTRVVSPSIPDLYDYTPEPTGTTSVDYTIFYNPASEEMNLL